MFGVHINMAHDIWDAVRKYAEATDEPLSVGRLEPYCENALDS
jgi:hypothetical protein